MGPLVTDGTGAGPGAGGALVRVVDEAGMMLDIFPEQTLIASDFHMNFRGELTFHEFA
ncbi:hypothetical protein ACIHEJ_26155 [Streptomyces sp. NPDC052301]|uniref:hypothetical protein n=1 Tax=Streptomyces sp. NPDC052301 TaxID=3365687 RepID=UPI0037D12314